ncbi:MAG: GNAT family N-acetyltransferase [Desulfobacteraceae bacterium]|nr:GNAT family N-acetyltransferase [Desulfobacteraceae bacterium]
MVCKIEEALLSDVFVLANIIRNAFKDVALRFDLTEGNCPRHPSNCTAQWVESALHNQVRYFMLQCDGTPCGCVALEQAKPEVCYLERLAVLPDYRRRGFGKALVEHAISRAESLGAYRIEIGIISEHKELKSWYEALGFVQTGTGVFRHLPFEVTFMARGLGVAG